MLRKPQPKEGGAIGPVTPLLQMSGIPLICYLGKPPLYPVLNETLPKWLSKYLLISEYLLPTTKYLLGKNCGFRFQGHHLWIISGSESLLKASVSTIA